ncbi:MAG: transcriptional repressor [Acidimicrobiia bacterium]|nr:transcriptional repressor [Acidimicrobiia bacterium]
MRERIVGRLARGDQRLTSSREALVAVLAVSDRPLTIPEIGAADGGLAVSSIYRNLTMLEEVGVVHRVVTASGDFAHYELTEDLTEHHHHHLVCSGCGSVEDFEASSQLEDSVRDAARRIARRSGFRIDRHLIDLIGLCPNCA